MYLFGNVLVKCVGDLNRVEKDKIYFKSIFFVF